MKTTDWIQTYTGRKFYPLEPDPTDICIEDIAHTLSMLCRFGGHCRTFYSVAQHCVHVSYCVPSEHALWGLLHDASEAYLVDLPSPVKRCVSGYKEAEKRLLAAVCERFGLPPEEPAAVKEADIRMLETERHQLFDVPLRWEFTQGVQVYAMKIKPWRNQGARGAFLRRFKELS